MMFCEDGLSIQAKLLDAQHQRMPVQLIFFRRCLNSFYFHAVSVFAVKTDYELGKYIRRPKTKIN